MTPEARPIRCAGNSHFWKPIIRREMQNKHLQLHIFFILLLFWSLCTATLGQQQSSNKDSLAEKSNQKASRLPKIKPTPSRAVSTPEQEIPIAINLTIKPWEDSDSKVLTSTDNLSALTVADNPFAIDTSSLREPNQLLDQLKSDLEKEFGEIFKKREKDSGDEPNTELPAWFIFVFSGLLSLIAVSFASHRRSVGRIFTAFMQNNLSGLIYREQRSSKKNGVLLSVFIFNIVMGLFLFLLIHKFGNLKNFDRLLGLGICVGGVGGFYALKHLQLRIIASIFPFKKHITFYSFIVSNTNKVIGYTFPPIVFLVAYSPPYLQMPSVYFAFIILGLIYAYRNLKILLMASNIISLNKFHSLLYFCVVELAPILILLKAFSLI